MQTQQNSYLHFLHVMWLHPPFFSIVLWHLLHSFVLLLIQFAVSLSSLHFCSHIFATAQMTGRWSVSIGQPKQNTCVEVEQVTIGTVVSSDDLVAADTHDTVFVQDG